MKTSAGPVVIGWDIGGAHLKGALLEDGRVRDVAQWPCELWRGLSRLDDAFTTALERWKGWRQALHAVTMTGEMADLFPHREAGVAAIVSRALPLEDCWAESGSAASDASRAPTANANRDDMTAPRDAPSAACTG